MNRKQLVSIIDSITFSEKETELLLHGEPVETLSKELVKKIYFMGLDEWYDAIPRNLKVLFEN